MSNELSHIDNSGNITMVDVGHKPTNERVAVAAGEVWMALDTLGMIRQGIVKKGDVLTVAKIAGIQAAKKTSELIPLCHPLPINQVEVDLQMDDTLPGIQIRATVRTDAKTGVEMEALTAVSVAALTIYDMAKAVQKTMRIQNIRLLSKRGGTSGEIVNE